MIDLGDVQSLSYTNKDASGNPADGTAVSLTITLPDGTSSGALTPTHGATGIYTYTYTTVQSGRHEVRWTNTGTNPGAYTDVFYVAPADPGLIISLDEARRGLKLAAGNTVNDDDLRSYIQAATPIMEDLIGPIVSRSCTETHDGGYTTVETLYQPLISVTSVIESYGSTYERTLTAQNLFDGSAVDAYGYTVDLETGLITRRVSGVAAIFAPGRRNVQVVYTAGRSTLKGNHLMATRRLIRHLWQTEQQGFRPQMGQADLTMGYTPSGFAVPNAVIEMCADSLRAVGIA